MNKIINLTTSFVFAVLLASPLSGYAETASNTASGIIASRVIVVPDTAQEKAFDRICKWVNYSFQSSCRDHATGNILAKGEMSYPSPSINRIQYKILYTMQVALKGNSATVTFKEILLKSPNYYLPESSEESGGEINQVILERDRLAANKALARLVDNLQAHLDEVSDNRAGSACLNCTDVKNM